MSYVLTHSFPTSAAAGPADFAARLALDLGCPLKLINFYSTPFLGGEYPVTVIAPDELRQISSQQLEAAETRLHECYPALRLSTALGYGMLSDVLEDAISVEAPLLVIIGNDEADSASAPIGIATAETMASVTAPVLAVQSESTSMGLTHLCLAIRADSLERTARLEGLDELSQRMGFRITVVSIVPDAEARPYVSSPSGLMQQLTALEAQFSTLQVGDDDIEPVLIDFAVGLGADFVGVLKSERGFLSALFHKSHTRSLLKLAHIPILSLHATADGE